MADAWKTYPLPFKGGLISNLSPLQHGMLKPSSARILSNFEPSVQGGYRRIEGFSKFDDNIIPYYGEPMIFEEEAATSTAITLANIDIAPTQGDTFKIAGDNTTYTVGTVTPTDLATKKRVTFNVSPAIASTAATKAAVTFQTGSGDIEGLLAFEDTAIACRGNNIWNSAGAASGWTRINVPSYGTVTANGTNNSNASSISMAGLSAKPQAGDTFTIAGIDKVYTVMSSATGTGTQTISINPNLAAAVSSNQAITFLSSSRSSMTRHRFTTFNFAGTETAIGVDGANAPFKYDGSVFTVLNDAPSDVIGSSHVVNFKNRILYGKGSTLTYTTDFDETDFTAASGAGTINVGGVITGLIVFREQLIIFTERSILRLVGSSESDFNLQPITLDIGCIHEDTIQEIGGDILFLGPDGIRSLSGTDKIGDFGLAVVSKEVQDEVINFVNRNQTFSSLIIREKSQYRIFGFNTSITESSAQGLLATQLQEGLAWGELRGIRAKEASSNLNSGAELAIFGNTDGYIYRMESGNSFDNKNIIATFATPFLPITDPRVRKTLYKMHLYTDPQGSFNSNCQLKYDFSSTNVVQPPTITLSNASESNTQPIFGNVQFLHGGLVNNGSNYAASGNVSKIAVDNLSSISGLLAGDTFQVSKYRYKANGETSDVVDDTVEEENQVPLPLHGTGSGANFVPQAYTLVSFGTDGNGTNGLISSNATNLVFTPNLVADLIDNRHLTFTKVGGVPQITYGGESLQSIFEEQTTGSGFTASLQFDSESQDAPYSFDAVTLEFTEHSHS